MPAFIKPFVKPTHTDLFNKSQVAATFTGTIDLLSRRRRFKFYLQSCSHIYNRLRLSSIGLPARTHVNKATYFHPVTACFGT